VPVQFLKTGYYRINSIQLLSTDGDGSLDFTCYVVDNTTNKIALHMVKSGDGKDCAKEPNKWEWLAPKWALRNKFLKNLYKGIICTRIFIEERHAFPIISIQNFS
jgi:hypothetical protein